MSCLCCLSSDLLRTKLSYLLSQLGLVDSPMGTGGAPSVAPSGAPPVHVDPPAAGGGREDRTTKQKYKNANITNKADNKIRAELDAADALLDKVIACRMYFSIF